MQRTLHAPTFALLAALAATLVAGPAHARSLEPQPDAQTPKADAVTTGSVEGPRDKKKRRFEDCMAIWEPATHMTKRQWRRTCTNMYDDAVPNL
jgi:hypothetical protein